MFLFIKPTLKSLSWVKKNKRKFEATGSFVDVKRSGRPRKLKSPDLKRLVNRVKGKRRQSTRKTAATFTTSTGKKVSHETIRKSLRGAKLYPHRQRKAVFLTQSQKDRRVAMAKKYRRFDWTKGAYWDETEFELHGTPNIKDDIVWDERGVVVTYEKEAHPKKFKFGAAITVNGPTRLVQYTGTIDSELYIKMVDKVIPDINKLLPGNDWTYIQDGASCHNSKLTQTHLAGEVPHLFPKEDWPPNSPDDNPIENVFGYLETEICSKRYTTIESLEKAVREAWKKLTPEYCRNCIESIPSRLAKIVKSGGQYVVDT
jgi:transposase